MSTDGHRAGEGRHTGPIRVLLADDHTMFREGAALLLTTNDGVEVVGQVDMAEAAASAEEMRPDVVVMEVDGYVGVAREVLAGILGASSPPAVVVLTMHEDPRLARELLGAGASAYLTKGASFGQLLEAVRVAAGHHSKDGRLGELVFAFLPGKRLRLADAESDGASNGQPPLSERELEVVLLAARGMSNRQTANSLHISEATVKRHLANVYSKIGVHSRGEAVRKALAEGWISTRDLICEDPGGEVPAGPPGS